MGWIEQARLRAREQEKQKQEDLDEYNKAFKLWQTAQEPFFQDIRAQGKVSPWTWLKEAPNRLWRESVLDVREGMNPEIRNKINMGDISGPYYDPDAARDILFEKAKQNVRQGKAPW